MPKGELGRERAGSDFTFQAPTTSSNGLRVLRALQLQKPILLEGSPGVGKTALVSALGELSGHSVVRINLSEQTDMADLFGADLPVEGGCGGEFAWRDGPLLTALKASSWILLDELNLASQSVLEGLNAVLDHRQEVRVPELNRTFFLGEGRSRVFGCQNPVREGGARKGLPKSFLNRFTTVFMEPLGLADLEVVLHAAFPALPPNTLRLMSTFAEALSRSLAEAAFGTAGAPWDFNLRDLLRWAELSVRKGGGNPSLFLDFVYGAAMRGAGDRDRVHALYREVASEVGVSLPAHALLRLGSTPLLILEEKVVVGEAVLGRGQDPAPSALQQTPLLLQKQSGALEGLGLCLEMGWMPILVGPAAAGKTALVQLLAQIAARPLRVMTVSPEMDTIELLGGFEQVRAHLTSTLSSRRRRRSWISPESALFFRSRPTSTGSSRRRRAGFWRRWVAW
jgi:midasin